MPTSKAWPIRFFQRESRSGLPGAVPARDFLDELTERAAAKIAAVLVAVAEAPPPSFSGGGKWQAMHGEMSGCYEVRVRDANLNHRLICLLDRPGDDQGDPSIVCLGGFSKRLRTSAAAREYRRLASYRQEFLETRRTLS